MKIISDHLYLVKGLTAEVVGKHHGGYFSLSLSPDINTKKILEVKVNKETDTCYLLSIEGGLEFYIEKNDTEIIFIEDLGKIVKINNN